MTFTVYCYRQHVTCHVHHVTWCVFLARSYSSKWSECDQIQVSDVHSLLQYSMGSICILLGASTIQNGMEQTHKLLTNYRYLHVHWNVHRYKLCDMKWNCFSNTILLFTLSSTQLIDHVLYPNTSHWDCFSSFLITAYFSWYFVSKFKWHLHICISPLAQIPLKHIHVCIPLDYMEWESTPPRHRHCFIGVLYSCQASNNNPLGAGRMSPDWRLW